MGQSRRWMVLGWVDFATRWSDYWATLSTMPGMPSCPFGQESEVRKRINKKRI